MKANRMNKLFLGCSIATLVVFSTLSATSTAAPIYTALNSDPNSAQLQNDKSALLDSYLFDSGLMLTSFAGFFELVPLKDKFPVFLRRAVHLPRIRT